jgi:hypothetical protein
MKTINLLTVFVLFTFFGKAQQNTQTLTYQGFVFQTYTIPVSGYYLLTAKGGEGGSFRHYYDSTDIFIGGKGASMSCYYFFNEGEQLRIAVAGAGQSVVDLVADGFANMEDGAGGGGASSIVLVNGNSYLPVLFAGGGGGAGKGRDGDAGQVTQNGTPGRKYNGQTAGSAGVAGGGGGSSNGSGAGAGGAGYYTDGGSAVSGKTITAWGGQAYLSGNYGGGAHSGGDGGWGGGGEGGQGDWFNSISVSIVSLGSGGGGGGYSGGGAGFAIGDAEVVGPNGGGGGGGGSFVSPIANTNGLVQLSGDNSGNGVVTISGPITQTDVVNTPFNPYTWPANGVSYSSAGTYVYTDSANSVTRVLDLSFGLQSCNTYTRVDTTVTFCGGYTWPRNGRTYTQNMIDSIRIGCTKYIVRLIVAPPAAAGAIQGASNACRNRSIVFSVAPVPFATRYQWTLPKGATGSSTTNSITVHFNSQFNGGQIKVAAANNCGASAVQVKLVEKTVNAPSGQLRIAGPTDRISGVYSVTPIKGAATYTWKLSNSQARIVSGQGTAQIQLEAVPGFLGTELSVRASNCEGKGSKAEIVLGTVTEDYYDDDKDDDDDDDHEKDTKKFVNIKGTEAIDLANSKGMGIGTTSVSISAYPNPTSGKLTMQLPASVQQGKLEVYNKDGQLVQTLKVPARSQSIPIDLSTKAKGLYLIRYYAGQEMKSFKVVVK